MPEDAGLQAAHLEDLSSRPELVALLPAAQEVDGLAHVVPGILDLKTVSPCATTPCSSLGPCARVILQGGEALWLGVSGLQAEQRAGQAFFGDQLMGTGPAASSDDVSPGALGTPLGSSGFRCSAH